MQPYRAISSKIVVRLPGFEVSGTWLQHLTLFGFSRQSLSAALVPVLELALVDQAGLELTEILLPLPPKSWD